MMFDIPMTREEAQATVYEDGEPFVEGQCAHPAFREGEDHYHHQCRKNDGYGRDSENDIFCHQHDLKTGGTGVRPVGVKAHADLIPRTAPTR